MVRALVLRGAAVGAFGGLLAYLFAWVFADPAIQAAIQQSAAVQVLRFTAGDESGELTSEPVAALLRY